MMKYILLTILAFAPVAGHAQDTKNDWADLSKYEKADSLLKASDDSKNSIVFLGSSIIEFWQDLDPGYFSKNHYVDRGISGQLSPQLLIRFMADVIDLKPQAVVILAGSNDLARDTTPASYKRIMNNIRSMVELAQYNHIKVFLCTYVPIADYPWRRGLRPAKKIVALNKMIAGYAVKTAGVTILDFFTPLANSENGQRADLTRDGVHPNLRGYKALEAVTDKTIARWRRSRS